MARQLCTGEFGTFIWWEDPRDCPHYNANACPTCDHDGYYRAWMMRARRTR